MSFSTIWMEKELGTIYEVSYLLLPSIAEEQILAKSEGLKEMLQKTLGEVISSENPVLIDLAYPMTKVVGTTRHKASSGYFGWLKFEIEADGISKVKKYFDSNDEVLRFLIIKTVKENTLLHGKMMFKKEEKAKKDEGESSEPSDEVLDEPVKEPIPEDLDKSIDDLVIV